MAFVSIQDVFDFSAPLEHRPGDVWVDLPSFGLVGSGPTTGVVISPACDLSNNKIETITYLPVVPVKQYFGLPASLSIVRPALDRQVRALGINLSEIDWPENSFSVPSEPQIAAIRKYCSDLPEGSQTTQVARVLSGLDIVDIVRQGRRVDVDLASVATLLGTEYSEVKKRIMTNARGELHFLPADRQAPEWASVMHHSLVLFRYPITVPLELLDLAQSTDDSGWDAKLCACAERIPVAGQFKSARPSKRSTINQAFMADLLTRYLAVYLRLGSPDFSPQSIQKFSEELDK